MTVRKKIVKKSYHPDLRVRNARRMALRAPNQHIQKKSVRLRKERIDKSRLEPQRLQKILANSGLGSRRDMEKLIEQGQVLVNGKTAKLGDKVQPTDKVLINHRRQLKLNFADRLPRILLYHKEVGELVSRNDPRYRQTVFMRIPLLKDQKWRVVGRLDMNTSGLLIFTTSGDLVNRFSHPRFAIDREYAVRVKGILTIEQMHQLTHKGVMLSDGLAKVASIQERQVVDERSQYRWYNLVLQEGRNREVRRIFEFFGLIVSRLIRTRFGPIAIPPRLKSGLYYELNEVEVEYVLKEMGVLKNINKKFLYSYI